MAEIQNKKLMQGNPTFFDNYDIPNSKIHFVGTESEQYFLEGEKEEVVDIIEKGGKKWSIRIDQSNMRRQFILKL